VRTKSFKLSVIALAALTVLATLVACFLMRMGQTHLGGLRGEPSQFVDAHSSGLLAKDLAQVTHQRVRLPENELGLLGEKILDNFPTLADFKNLTDEQVHTMPAILFQAGLKLKTFEDRLDQKMKASQDNPKARQELASEGALFYQNCSNDEQTASALRAVCYLHFIKLSVESGHPENIPKYRMPLDVITIAKAISPQKT
jgi:hypothetical protein